MTPFIAALAVFGFVFWCSYVGIAYLIYGDDVEPEPVQPPEPVGWQDPDDGGW